MRKFGIEIEFGGDRFAAMDRLHAVGLMENTQQHGYVGHGSTHWVMKTDGSVPDGGELVSPPLDFDDPEARGQVNKACKAMKEAGARTSTHAGIHIHIDASDMDAAQVALVARTFTKFEDVLYRLASSGWQSMRPGARSFCKPLTQAQIQGLATARNQAQVERAYYGSTGGRRGHGDPSRYCGINLHSYFYRGTIEFRIFNSSLNADRIQAYIAICMALVEDARRGNKRSVNKAFRLGGMKAGTTDAKAAYHRFQQVVRYSAGMDLADYKLMNKCWKDSQPQDQIPVW